MFIFRYSKLCSALAEAIYVKGYARDFEGVQSGHFISFIEQKPFFMFIIQDYGASPQKTFSIIHIGNRKYFLYIEVRLGAEQLVAITKCEIPF